MSVCMNCSTHGAEDMDVISHLIKIRLKPKVLLNHYMLCIRCAGGAGDGGAGVGGAWPPGAWGVGGSRSSSLCLAVPRELLNAHKDNLGTTIKFVIFNELSNARNPNNMQILYTVLQHSSELAPKVGPGTPRPGPRGRECVRRPWQGPGAGPGCAAAAIGACPGASGSRGLWEASCCPKDESCGGRVTWGRQPAAPRSLSPVPGHGVPGPTDQQGRLPAGLPGLVA